MTDNEIIKALELCRNENGICSDCPYSDDYTNCNTRIAKDVLDLINRQKAEVEKLQEYYKMYYDRMREIKELQDEVEHSSYKISLFDETIKTAKSEAIKEFAERLKGHAEPQYPWLYTVDVDFIDNLVKEMVGDNNAE